MKRSIVFRFTAALFALFIITAIYPLPALAEEPYEYFTFQVVGNEATLTHYSSNKTAVAIPSAYEGYPVTCIGDGAFWDCDSIESVSIPSTVKTISINAFYSCGSLKSITIPGSVTKIGDDAFDSCSALESIVIPNTVTILGDRMFLNCGSLKNVTLPNGITTMLGTFAYCSSLTGVTLPNTVTYLAGTFNGCESLASITLPSSVVFIGANAFLDCKNLSSITIPGNVQTIGSSAFRLCTSLQTVVMPDSVRDINDNAFEYCPNIKSITIPVNVTNIGKAAFINCTSLTRAVFRGDMPSFGNQYVFTGTAPSFKVYYHVSHAASWSSYFDFPKQAYCMASIYPNNGSASYKVMTDVNNGHIAALATPVYANHVFKGWYKDSALQQPWNFSTDTITADVTLFAKWVPNTCTVAFNSQGGTAVAPKTVTYNSLLTAPTPPTRSGYVFMGWYKDSTSTKPWNFVTDKVTANITLYAKWVSTTPVAKAISSSYNSVYISWAAVPKAAGYTIYRATTATGTYSLVGTVTTAHYTNTGLTTGKTYYYKVRSYTLSGTTRNYSNYSAITSAIPIPAAPAATAARYNSTSIKITWSAVAGATGYEVCRSTSATGTYVSIKTTTSLSFINTGLTTGKTFYYKVRAYRLVGTTKMYGNSSKVVYATP